ncbi:signal transduction histidine kinase [Streptomyces umbrinus]|uniref:ATP-binding protein n=1 Tax=Streptomyces umbrinus TaxID=67370 RepID=UPI00167CD5EF|nr:sensor histidine kinase [Streptomyces umbrinus]MCR3729761.1 signal transduction histidine kinase [Streptomyces umbrinus]
MERFRARWSWLDAAIVAVAGGLGAVSVVLGPSSGGGATEWVLVGTAAVALGLVRHVPLIVFAVEVVLTLVGDSVLPEGSHVAPLAGVVALGAVAYRHRWLATAAAYLVGYATILVAFGSDDGGLLTGVDGLVRIVTLALTVAAPVAFGRYLAGVRLAAAVAEERVRDAEQRRDAEMQAIRLAERARIAGDLHDLVAHHVSAIALQAGTAQYAATHAPDPEQRLSVAVDSLGAIHTSAGQALVDLRSLLRVLRNPSEQESLVDPEQMIADAVQRSRTAGLHVVAHLDDGTAEAPLTLRVTAARVVQEALTNALKHAGPGAEVETTVDVDDTQLSVEVANSGPVGPHPTLPASGHGLAGMRERVEILGGTLAAGPTRTGGWRLRVTLPLGARS